jgi:hypothetical protein
MSTTPVYLTDPQGNAYTATNPLPVLICTTPPVPAYNAGTESLSGILSNVYHQWTLNETSGTTVYDAKNQIPINGNTSSDISNYTAPGRIDKCFHF